MEFPGWSDYNYVLGNPVVLVDLDGRAPSFGDPPFTTNGFYYIQEGFRRMFQAGARSVDQFGLSIYSKKITTHRKSESKLGTFTIIRTTKTEVQSSVGVNTNLEQIFMPQNNAIVVDKPIIEADTKTSINFVKQTDIKGKKNNQFIKGTNRVQADLSNGDVSISNQLSVGLEAKLTDETKSVEISGFVKQTLKENEMSSEVGVQAKIKYETSSRSTNEIGIKAFIKDTENN